MNRTGKNTTGWARRLTALLVTACLVMAMALPVYAEVDLLPDAPDEVELLEDEQGTASGAVSYTHLTLPTTRIV